MKCYLLLNPAKGKPLAVAGDLEHHHYPSSVTFSSQDLIDLLDRNAKEHERGGDLETVDQVVGRLNQITLYDPVFQFGWDDRFEAYGYRFTEDMDQHERGPELYQKFMLRLSQVVPKGYRVIKVIPTGLFT